MTELGGINNVNHQRVHTNSLDLIDFFTAMGYIIIDNRL